MREEFNAYGALLVSSLVPIIAGAHASLKMPKEAKLRRQQVLGEKAKEEEENDEDEPDDEEIDRLTMEDAYLFPVLGSAVLLSLYLALKYLNKDVLNKIFQYYFAFMALAALSRTISCAAMLLVSQEWKKSQTKWKLSLQRNKASQGSLSATSTQIVTTLVGSALTAVHHLLISQHWISSNLIALAFSFNAISLLRLDSFKTGAVLLGGLFAYDVWWVFFTPVMVSVAKNLEAPIKIVFPRDISSVAKGFALLGLGDIVLPGIFIALALRFDYHLAIKSTCPPTPSSRFSRPYFWTCLVFYVIGLVTTITVMHTFKAAQPALLYLSPACVGSVMLCAFLRGESKALWAFSDESDDDKKPPKRGKEDGKESEEPETNGEAVDANIHQEEERVFSNTSSFETGNGNQVELRKRSIEREKIVK